MTDRLPLVLIQGSPSTIQELPVGDELDPDAFGLTSAPVGVDDAQTLTQKTLTAPHVEGGIYQGTSPVRVHDFLGTASAANYLRSVNNVAGSAPRLQALGADADVSLDLESKGAGIVRARVGGVSRQIATTTGVETFSNKVYVAPTIGATDWANANHDHSSAARGGFLTSSAFQVGSNVARALPAICTASTAIANTVAGTDFDNWTYTDTLNAWLGTVGAAVRINFAGKFSTILTPTIRFLIKGSVFSTIWDSGVITCPTVTNDLWGFSVLIATRTIGGAGVITFSTPQPITLGTSMPRVTMSTVSCNFPVDGIVSNDWKLRCQWGTASASNTITLESVIHERLN